MALISYTIVCVVLCAASAFAFANAHQNYAFHCVLILFCFKLVTLTFIIFCIYTHMLFYALHLMFLFLHIYYFAYKVIACKYITHVFNMTPYAINNS